MDEREKLLIDIQFLKDIGEFDGKMLLKIINEKYLFVESKSY